MPTDHVLTRIRQIGLRYGRTVQVVLVVAVFTLAAGLVFLPFSDEIRQAWKNAGVDDVTLDLLTTGVGIVRTFLAACILGGVIIGVRDVVRRRRD